MPAEIFQRGNQFCYDADALAGGNGASVSEFADQSVFNRTLVGSSAFPVIKANAWQGKKSVVWNGSKNPLSFTGDFRFNCVFLIVKIAGNFPSFNGVLSSPVTYPMLEGQPNTGNFFDNQYPYVEYQLDGVVQNPTEIWAGGDTIKYHAPPAPVDRFGIVYLRYWKKFVVDGIQLGQDRNFADRKGNFELLFAAGYDRDFSDKEVRLMTRSLSWEYKIPLCETFPFNGSRADESELEKIIITDEQDDPVTHIKREAREAFAPNFGTRTTAELEKIKAFYKYAYPGKSFYYRDFATVPPVDTLCLFKQKTKVKYTRNHNTSNYGLEFVETTKAPAMIVPAIKPLIETEFVSAPDSVLPSKVEELTAAAPTAATLSLDWKDATDNHGIFGYVIECAENDEFTVGLRSRVHLNSATSAYVYPGLEPSKTYYFRVKAKDISQNLSAEWSNVAYGTTLGFGGGGSAPVFATLTLTGGIQNQAYSRTISVSGGTGAITFSLAAGALPTGTAINSAGVISGTLTTAGTFNFTVRATDAGGNFSERAYSVVVVADSAPLITTTSLPAGTQGAAYNQTISASSGNAPLAFALQSGALPTGLTLDNLTSSSCRISGTISGATGTYAFTIRATDTDGDFDDQAYMLTVAAAGTGGGSSEMQDAAGNDWLDAAGNQAVNNFNEV